MDGKVIQLKCTKPLSCRFIESCPLAKLPAGDDPVGALYAIVTRSGDVLEGVHKVQKDQLEDLLLSLDRLTVKLHQAIAA